MQSLRERVEPSKRQGWRGGGGGGRGWRSVCRASVHLSRVLSSARIRSLFTDGLAFSRTLHRECWRETCLLCDPPRSYALRRAELPLSMNPMRGGGPAAVCAREHKADFQWFTSSHQTHAARIAVKTPSAAVFHSSARFSCPDRFHSRPAKVGGKRVSRWNREHSVVRT